MTEEQKKIMEQLGITYETKTIFHFQGHRYDHLDDAIKYAKKVRHSLSDVKTA